MAISEDSARVFEATCASDSGDGNRKLEGIDARFNLSQYSDACRQCGNHGPAFANVPGVAASIYTVIEGAANSGGSYCDWCWFADTAACTAIAFTTDICSAEGTRRGKDLQVDRSFDVRDSHGGCALALLTSRTTQLRHIESSR